MSFIDRHIKIIVWTLRIIVGATFIFSGFVKAVDPWGFMYKIHDYFMAWEVDFVPRASELITAISLSMAEFTIGVMLVLGCWRRVAGFCVFLFMCFMLPLTLYIAIFSPVEDCGCFGDALVLSNWATFGKNAVLFPMAWMLLRWNRRVIGLYPPISQWVVLIVTVLYSATLSAIGYLLQPMVDFRPYPVGSAITEDIGDVDMKMVYEKDGERKAFSIYSLPGEDWTFVGREEKANSDNRLAVFDGAEEVTADVFAVEGAELILVVSDPEYHTRARSSMANKLNEYVIGEGGTMIGLVPLVGQKLEEWKEIASPDFDVYSADDTQLKELARGDAALVYLDNGIIKWKRNLYFLPGNILEEGDGNPLQSVYAPDSGRPIINMTLAYVGLLLLLFLISIPFLRKYIDTYLTPNENE